MTKINHTHCCYCRRAFSETEPHLKKTVDHFYPTSRKGLNKDENKLQCCWQCNNWKADKLPIVWLNEVELLFIKKKSRRLYVLRDFAQIIGSLKHFLKTLKHVKISEYKL